jgi:hypothetical protein
VLVRLKLPLLLICFLLSDSHGLVYIIINLATYPQRCTQMCLEEFQQTVSPSISLCPSVSLSLCPSLSLLSSRTPPSVCPQFEMKFSSELLTAKENKFTKPFKEQFRKLCLKYNNTADVDAIASAKKKVESVKLIMEKNIELTLQNCVKIENMEKATGERHPFLSLSLCLSLSSHVSSVCQMN